MLCKNKVGTRNPMWQGSGYIMYLEFDLLLIKWKYIMDTYDLNMLGKVRN
jgi:hypothetical protein